MRTRVGFCWWLAAIAAWVVFGLLLAARCARAFDAAALMPIVSAPTERAATPTVAWYRAEDNAVDSINAYNGTWTGTETYAAGMVGKAFDFASAKVTVGDQDLLDLTNEYTVAAWIFADSWGGGGFGRVVDKAAVGLGTGWGFYISSATSSAIFIHYGGASAISASSSIGTNAWYHIAATRSGTSTRVYVNGAASGSPATTSAAVATTASMLIGDRVDGGRAFDGRVDEVRIYNRALTAAEVATLYNDRAAP